MFNSSGQLARASFIRRHACVVPPTIVLSLSNDLSIMILRVETNPSILFLEKRREIKFFRFSLTAFESNDKWKNIIENLIKKNEVDVILPLNRQSGFHNLAVIIRSFRPRNDWAGNVREPSYQTKESGETLRPIAAVCQ